MMIRRLALVTGFVVLNAFGFAAGARAGEGGVAGSAAFTVNTGNVTGVAVSAAVGKENAAAQAFNYDASVNGLQNSAFAIGTAGTLNNTLVGDPAGTTVSSAQDTARGTAQGNTITKGYTINIGTASGDALGTAAP
jgi:hypothetical protein